ncbi:hypothetical protein JG687_00003767 [Phytophthora cactorum]|uniref:Uncharacterized protein n=1 Tax=Phytophthora cactorum TaxID=29920 RepID=A0A8T1UQN0_9STRA|nr:hypothetical protein JG687_00003767 [Phytophthora cactorum]
MKSTGIPAHLAVAKEVKELREEVANLNKEIKQLNTDVETKLPGSVADKPSRECEAVTPIETPPSDWRTWQWGVGQLGHAVPKGWEFPAHTSVKQM